MSRIQIQAAKLLENYRRNRSEQGTFEKYVGPIFGIGTALSFIFIPERERESSMKYFFILAMVYATTLYWSVRKTRRQVIDKNREIEKKNEIIIEQKRKVEEKQKEILDSIQYARRLQTSLLPRELYIEKKLNGLKKT
jgi:hypothetical protein